MAKEEKPSAVRKRGVILSSTLLASTGIAFIILTFFPMSYVPHMGVLGAFGLASAIGLFKGKKWGFYMGVAVIPLYITVGASLLYVIPSGFGSLYEVPVALTCAGLAIFIFLMVAALFYVASRRELFR